MAPLTAVQLKVTWAFPAVAAKPVGAAGGLVVEFVEPVELVELEFVGLWQPAKMSRPKRTDTTLWVNLILTTSRKFNLALNATRKCDEKHRCELKINGSSYPNMPALTANITLFGAFH